MTAAPPDEPTDPARAANEAASTCIDERRFVDAIAPAEQAAALAPGWSQPWSNLVVAYKHARRWQDCLDAADRRLAVDPDDADGVHWNAGIAATALGDWGLARRCWTALGFEVPPGEGPFALELGEAAVEVGDATRAPVACVRLDPCRARIEGVPRPATDRRCGDLILHDGELCGVQTQGDRRVPVFAELGLLERSRLGTWELVLDGGGEELVRELRGWDRTTRVERWDDADACIFGVAAKDESMLKPLRRLLGGWRREVRSVRRVL